MSRSLVIGLAVGVPIMLFGLGGLLVNARDTRPPNWSVWFAGSLLAHDLVLAPLVFATGWLARRLLPERARRALTAPLVLSGFVVVLAWPLVRGYGARADNPTIQPRDYTRGTLVVLSLIWLAALVSGLRERRSGSRPPPR